MQEIVILQSRRIFIMQQTTGSIVYSTVVSSVVRVTCLQYYSGVFFPSMHYGSVAVISMRFDVCCLLFSSPWKLERGGTLENAPNSTASATTTTTKQQNQRAPPSNIHYCSTKKQSINQSINQST